jgi:hypothetical protein
MNLPILAVVAVAALPCMASAESLRCTGGIVAEGDSRLSVFYKCGPPNLADVYCAPVYFPGTLQPVPEPFASGFVPCQQVEALLYERGPGELVATVYVRSGVVQSIEYGRVPR